MRTTLRLALAAVAAGALAAPAAADASGYSATVVEDQPLAYYRLNEAPAATVAHDEVGSADAKLTGVSLGQAAPFPDAGASARFAGAASAATATVSGAAASAELWVKPATNGRNQTLLSHGDPSGSGWSLSIGQKKKVTFTSGGKPTTSRITLPSSAWTLLTVTWEPGRVRFYANGSPRNPVAPNGALPTAQTAASLQIGGGLNGSVDEVALYERPLSAETVAAHFTATQLPMNTVLPTVSGATVSGQTLAVRPGTWTGATGALSYQWQRCDAAGDNCDDVADATGSTYTLTAADVDHMIQVEETATDAAGSVAAVSDPVGPVTAPPASGTPTDPGAGTGPGATTPTDPGAVTGPGATTPTDPGAGAGAGTGGTPIDPGAGGTTTGPGPGTGGTPTVPAQTTPQAPAMPATTGSTPTTGGPAPAGAAPANAPVATAPGVCPRTTAATARKRMRMRGAGRLVLVVRRDGRRVSMRLRAKRGALRKVVYRVDRRRLGGTRRAPFALRVARALRPGTHDVRATVTPRHGHARTVRLRLRVPTTCGS